VTVAVAVVVVVVRRERGCVTYVCIFMHPSACSVHTQTHEHTRAHIPGKGCQVCLGSAPRPPVAAAAAAAAHAPSPQLCRQHQHRRWRLHRQQQQQQQLRSCACSVAFGMRGGGETTPGHRHPAQRAPGEMNNTARLA